MPKVPDLQLAQLWRDRFRRFASKNTPSAHAIAGGEDCNPVRWAVARAPSFPSNFRAL